MWEWFLPPLKMVGDGFFGGVYCHKIFGVFNGLRVVSKWPQAICCGVHRHDAGETGSGGRAARTSGAQRDWERFSSGRVRWVRVGTED